MKSDIIHQQYLYRKAYKSSWTELNGLTKGQANF